MTDSNDPRSVRARTGGRYRRRSASPRDYRLTPRFTDEELATIRNAAEAMDMTATGFCASAALAAAQPDTDDQHDITDEELAEMQRELYAARVAVNRAGVNLNQAVAELNTTGTPPVWLEDAVARSVKAVEELDEVVSRIHRRLA
jgi:uncharacterized protein (DUF1778 family)